MVDLTGSRFGKLVVTGFNRAEKRVTKSGTPYWAWLFLHQASLEERMEPPKNSNHTGNDNWATVPETMIDNFAGKDIHQEWEEDQEEHALIQKKLTKARATLLCFAILFGVAGFCLVAWFDWRLALGTLFLMCGDNAARAARK